MSVTLKIFKRKIHCLEEPLQPLLQYCLECPATASLHRPSAPLPNPDHLAAATVVRTTPLPTLLQTILSSPPPW